MASTVSGIDPGQRQLNGTQTSGREYRELSTPGYRMTQDDDVAVPMRDGINLMADVYRPDAPGRFPVLIAASPYPRQVQNLGAPFGFIEAGASDFGVPAATCTSSRMRAAPVGQVAPSGSSTPRNVATCTTWSSGPRLSRGRMATSACSASAILR